ncbi:hypothetical protein ACH0CI_27775 [Priestia sp. 179-F W1.4 NHS]|uniref:hypothetical protein n=1 Tax=Priestia sp. 179-F W1.4 NHS TaxID=3374296 RepID=UPI00387A352E
MSILEILVHNQILGLSIFNNTWFQAIVTAFSAAALTQWLNNAFTKERDRENKIKESFKLFYDKAIPEIMDLFNIETDFRRGFTLETLETDEIRDSILDRVSKNTLHINSEVYDSYRSVMTNKYKENNTFFQQQVVDITLYHTIVEEYIKLAEKHEGKDLKKEYRYACFLVIWKNVVINCEGIENSIGALSDAASSNNSPFDLEKLNKETLQKLKHMDEEHGAKKDVLFREILKDIIIQKDDMDKESFEEFIETFFSYYSPEISNNEWLALDSNSDIFSGDESLEHRTLYRNRILRDLYQAKYSVDSFDDFTFNKEGFADYINYHFERKNAVSYWEEKNILKIEHKGDAFKIVLTAKGDDYYEEHLYRS